MPRSSGGAEWCREAVSRRDVAKRCCAAPPSGGPAGCRSARCRSARNQICPGARPARGRRAAAALVRGQRAAMGAAAGVTAAPFGERRAPFGERSALFGQRRALFGERRSPFVKTRTPFRGPDTPTDAPGLPVPAKTREEGRLFLSPEKRLPVPQKKPRGGCGPSARKQVWFRAEREARQPAGRWRCRAGGSDVPQTSMSASTLTIGCGLVFGSGFFRASSRRQVWFRAKRDARQPAGRGAPAPARGRGAAGGGRKKRRVGGRGVFPAGGGARGAGA
jgi:hypothetical protein